MILNTHEPAVLPVPKNCFRCGQDFQDFSDRGLARVCPECKKPKPRPPRYSPALLGQPLTFRETQVCQLLADGKLSKEIAYELHLGVGHIKVVVSMILAKTGMANRICLAVWWATRRQK